MNSPAAQAGPTTIAAEYLGVRVPMSPFLNDTRIDRINKGRYEGQEIAGALSVATSADRILELGAGIGVVGAVIAENVRPAAMMSFEANPELIPHIKALHALNGLQDFIVLKNQILIASPGRPEEIDFHLGRAGFLGSSLIKSGAPKSKTISVSTASYETVRTSFKPTVLIMDIEGGELDFFESADLSGVRAVVVEFHPMAYGVAGMRQCKNVLRDAGFVRVDEHSTRTVWTCERPSQDNP